MKNKVFSNNIIHMFRLFLKNYLKNNNYMNIKND